MHHDLTLCDWRLSSELPLPGLAPWRGDDRPADIVLTLGEVPPMEDPHPLYDGPLVKLGRDHSVRFEVPGVITFQLSEGRRIVTQLHGDDPTDPTIRTFLFGAILGLICHQRGRPILHASCVEIDGRAVALAGPSGMGKSTLAAALMARGHRVLSDDLCLIDLDGPVAIPTFRRLKLWRDSSEALQIDTAALPRVRPELEKYELPLDEDFCSRPVPLAAVALLAPPTQTHLVTFGRLHSVQAASSLHRQVFRRSLANRMGRHSAMFAEMTRLADEVRVERTMVKPGFEALGSMTRWVEDLARA
ncbi:hypothetical protein [Endothiovibrio diazotrophicus]